MHHVLGMGSFGLELRVLSRELGDERYRAAADGVHALVYARWAAAGGEKYTFPTRRANSGGGSGGGVGGGVGSGSGGSGGGDGGGGGGGGGAAARLSRSRSDGFHPRLWTSAPPLWAPGAAAADVRSALRDPWQGIAAGADVAFGSGGDSYYEYLLKGRFTYARFCQSLLAFAIKHIFLRFFPSLPYLNKPTRTFFITPLLLILIPVVPFLPFHNPEHLHEPKRTSFMTPLQSNTHCLFLAYFS
jgi:hypothetical protein